MAAVYRAKRALVCRLPLAVGAMVAVGLPAAMAQSVYNVPPDMLPAQLQAGDTLNLQSGGTLPESFSIPAGVTLHVTGGTVGENLSVVPGGNLQLTSGMVGTSSGVFGTARIAGGTVETSFDAGNNSTIVITGGTVEFGYASRPGSQTIIAGGDIGFGFVAENNSLVHLFGTDFTLAGAPVAGLEELGDTVTVNERGGALLAGTLVDGSPIDLVLATSVGGLDRIDAGATLRLTRLHAGDFDNNGVVNFSDYALLKGQYGTAVASPGMGADHNFSGIVDAADYTVWRDRLGSTLVELELPGDFNSDSTVDSLDYVFWKNSLGNSVASPGSGADHNLNGMVDVGDYTIWRDHLGTSLPTVAHAVSATQIPEPSAGVIVAVALALAAGRRSAGGGLRPAKQGS